MSALDDAAIPPVTGVMTVEPFRVGNVTELMAYVPATMLPVAAAEILT